VSLGKRTRRRRTRHWFAFYTLVLVAIVVASVWTRQWSVAATTLAIAVLFGLFTRHVWRRR
jgi:hypothetical protein